MFFPTTISMMLFSSPRRQSILPLKFHLPLQAKRNMPLLPRNSKCFWPRNNNKNLNPLTSLNLSVNDRDDENPFATMLENFVQTITGNPNYQFGDYSKRALSDMTGKNFTDSDLNETYQLGDVTKNILNTAGRTMTGKKDYQFGDITKGILDASVEEWTSEASLESLLENLSISQRRSLILLMIRWLATGLLSWAFWTNICTSVLVTLAWFRAYYTVGIISSKLFVDTFLQSYSLLRLISDPFVLIFTGSSALFSVFHYRRFLDYLDERITSKLFREQKKKYLLSRAVTLFLAFLSNMIVALLGTTIVILFGSVAFTKV